MESFKIVFRETYGSRTTEQIGIGRGWESVRNFNIGASLIPVSIQ
uniref:Uncharacterized protein n=1 Tax=Anguilla anguilla TaxID=7936 RepID=A0A0E9TXR1_ANGAN